MLAYSAGERKEVALKVPGELAQRIMHNKWQQNDTRVRAWLAKEVESCTGRRGEKYALMLFYDTTQHRPKWRRRTSDRSACMQNINIPFVRSRMRNLCYTRAPDIDGCNWKIITDSNIILNSRTASQSCPNGV